MQREIEAAIYNVNQPAEGEEVPAEEAKNLAEAFDICRSEIETVQRYVVYPLESLFNTDAVSRAIMDKQGSRVVWEGLLATVKVGGVCEACNRGIKHEEKNTVTRHVSCCRSRAHCIATDPGTMTDGSKNPATYGSRASWG